MYDLFITTFCGSGESRIKGCPNNRTRNPSTLIKRLLSRVPVLVISVEGAEWGGVGRESQDSPSLFGLSFPCSSLEDSYHLVPPLLPVSFPGVLPTPSSPTLLPSSFRETDTTPTTWSRV